MQVIDLYLLCLFFVFSFGIEGFWLLAASPLSVVFSRT